MRKIHQRLTALLLSLVSCLTLGGTACLALADCEAADFPDYDETAWYAEPVSLAVDNGLLQGTDQGLLLPDETLTRAEMAAVIDRAFGTYMTTDITRFPDVDPDAWYYSEVQMAVHMGTYEGNANGTMTPDNPITRQEVMTVLCRALQLDTDRYADTDLSGFADEDEIAQWALPYVRAMVGAGYVQGRPEGLAPADSITRAEFAQLFANIIGEYLTEPGEYTGDRTGNLLIRTGNVTLSDMTVDGDLIIGCGAADDPVILNNVTVTGRLVVWGGGTDAVFCSQGTKIEELVVCRVDGPVKVIFDRTSTLASVEDILVLITDRAEEFPDTEVIFYDFSDLLAEQENLNDSMAGRELSVSLSAHLYSLTGDTAVTGTIGNLSDRDTYIVELRREDTGDLLCPALILEPGTVLTGFALDQGLDAGNYPVIAKVTAFRNDQVVGTVILNTTLHTAWLWNL